MFAEYRLNLASLAIYRNLLDDPVVSALSTWLDSSAVEDCNHIENASRYHHFCYQLLRTGQCWPCYLQSLILQDDNVFSQSAENRDVAEKGLMDLAARDLQLLQKVASLDFAALAPQGADTLILNHLGCRGVQAGKSVFKDAANWSQEIDGLAEHYRSNSRGVMAGYKALRWDTESGLEGISHPHQPRMQDLIGYDYQKEMLCQNTEQFISGRPANNVLLYGSSGTGKSTMIKALLHHYRHEPLRMVEVQRDSLKSLHRLAETLSSYRLRFIVFIDDLSFENYETEYKGLKAILEGSLQGQNGNILIYATSNRRHLVKEYFRDRDMLDEEIHAYDTQQEKLSLADRFGLTLTFGTPNQEEYLAIVLGVAQREGLNIEPAVLRREALQFERARRGPSGRTAQQFINYMAGRAHRNRTTHRPDEA